MNGCAIQHISANATLCRSDWPRVPLISRRAATGTSPVAGGESVVSPFLCQHRALASPTPAARNHIPSASPAVRCSKRGPFSPWDRQRGEIIFLKILSSPSDRANTAFRQREPNRLVRPEPTFVTATPSRHFLHQRGANHNFSCQFLNLRTIIWPLPPKNIADGHPGIRLVSPVAVRIGGAS